MSAALSRFDQTRVRDYYEANTAAFAVYGQGGAEGGCFLHNSRYDFNDAVIPLGAGYLAALAEQAMPITDR